MADPQASTERARHIVQRHLAGEALAAGDVDFLAVFVRRVLRAGGRAPSEARSKIEGRNQLVVEVADVLYPTSTPSAAGRRLEALARTWTPERAATVPAPVGALLTRLARVGLPGAKQVENIIRHHRKRNGQEISST